MTTFLFLRITHDLLELPRSGDTRRAAHSSVDQDPGAGLLPLAWACPTAISRPPHHTPPAWLAPFRGSSVTIDVHGSLDRAKDVSSFVEALVRRYREECVRLAHADDVPLLTSSRGHLLSPVRLPTWERAPCRRDGPAKTRISPSTREG